MKMSGRLASVDYFASLGCRGYAQMIIRNKGRDYIIMDMKPERAKRLSLLRHSDIERITFDGLAMKKGRCFITDKTRIYIENKQKIY